MVLLQRDAIVGHAEAIRTQSRKPPKANKRDARQPTNAGQPHSTRRKEATPQLGAAHAASEDTTHTSNHTACHQGRHCSTWLSLPYRLPTSTPAQHTAVVSGWPLQSAVVSPFTCILPPKRSSAGVLAGNYALLSISCHLQKLHNRAFMPADKPVKPRMHCRTPLQLTLFTLAVHSFLPYHYFFL